MKKLKVFLSYNSIDKKLAGSIKSNLKNYGIVVFLAHEDIEPTQEWTDKILVELNNSDIFLPILTKNFSKSKWTSQETGIALANKLLIISLKIDIDPFGFLSRFQALKFTNKNISSSCLRIIRVIHKNIKLKKKLLDGLIYKFENSSTFDEATKRSELLNKYDGYTKLQITEILRSSIENFQIYHSWGAQRRLDNLFNTNRGKVDSQLYKKYLKKISK